MKPCHEFNHRIGDETCGRTTLTKKGLIYEDDVVTVYKTFEDTSYRTHDLYLIDCLGWVKAEGKEMYTLCKRRIVHGPCHIYRKGIANDHDRVRAVKECTVSEVCSFLCLCGYYPVHNRFC